MWRRFLPVLLCALLCLFLSSFPLRAQSSQAISETAKPLWSLLLKSTTDLPQQIDSLIASSQTQIDFLSKNNELLQASNASLQDSNQLLTQQGQDLQNSLTASQADLAISEQLRSQLGTQLSISLQSISRAEADAKALELQNSILRVVAWVALPALAVETTYIVLHLAGVLK